MPTAAGDGPSGSEIAAWVARRCEAWARDPGGVPRGPRPADLEAFAMAFLKPTGTRREGPVTMPTYERPTDEQIEQLAQAWGAWRRAYFGSR